MRDVNQVAAQTPDDRSEFEITFRRGFRLGQRNRVKVRRELADLADLFRGSDQEILILAVEPAERAYDVAGISPNAKIGHSPDVNADFHDVI